MEENVFKMLRLEKNLDDMKDYTQKELSKDLGIAAAKICELEKGRKPSLTELQAYHKHFNAPYEYLLGENESRHYENMKVSREIGLNSEAIETIKRITQDTVLKRLLNTFIDKYIVGLLREISYGTYYVEVTNHNIVDGPGNAYENYCTYHKDMQAAEDKAIETLQDITNQTGYIFRVVSGDDNIEYCKLKAGEIVKKAVDEILQHWKK